MARPSQWPWAKLETMSIPNMPCNRVANNTLGAAPYQFVMLRTRACRLHYLPRVRTAAVTKISEANTSRTMIAATMYCAPIDRQKGRERLAHDRPCKRKRERLNRDRNDGPRVRLSGFVARLFCHEEENRTENNETHDDKIQRPKIRPAWHLNTIETKVLCRRELFHGVIHLVMLMD
jgi:hypothetical protein